MIEEDLELLQTEAPAPILAALERIGDVLDLLIDQPKVFDLIDDSKTIQLVGPRRQVAVQNPTASALKIGLFGREADYDLEMPAKSIYVSIAGVFEAFWWDYTTVPGAAPYARVCAVRLPLWTPGLSVWT